MFSISTMASSTRMPTTSVIARREMVFSENPSRSITKKVGMIDRGSATSVTTVARQSRRKIITTRIVSAAPSRRVFSAVS